jgi:hypothetical protein
MEDDGMASKRGQGEASLTVAILRQIRDEAKKTNARLDTLASEMRQGFALLGRRIDNVLLGEHRTEHEELRQRVDRIEQHLGLAPHP